MLSIDGRGAARGRGSTGGERENRIENSVRNGRRRVKRLGRPVDDISYLHGVVGNFFSFNYLMATLLADYAPLRPNGTSLVKD